MLISLCWILGALQDPGTLSDAEKESLRASVRQLDSEAIAERDEARRRIEAMGPRVLPFLREALKEAGPRETRALLHDLVEKLMPLSLDSILDHVRAAASADEKDRAQWKDPELTPLLQRLVLRAVAGTGRADFKLPLTLEDAAAARGNDRRGLRFLRGGTESFLERAFVMADGSVRITFAQDCVILSTGAVEISHGSGNVVVAGLYAEVTHDGTEVGSGSLILSGSSARVSHAASTILGAPYEVSVSHARQVVFLNSPRTTVSHRKDCRDATVPGILLGKAFPDADHPLAGRVEIVQAVKEDGLPAAVIVRRAGGAGEIVVREGKELLDPEGRAIAGLEGWSVWFITPQYVGFAKGKQRAAFVRKPTGFAPLLPR